MLLTFIALVDPSDQHAGRLTLIWVYRRLDDHLPVSSQHFKPLLAWSLGGAGKGRVGATEVQNPACRSIDPKEFIQLKRAEHAIRKLLEQPTINRHRIAADVVKRAAPAADLITDVGRFAIVISDSQVSRANVADIVPAKRLFDEIPLRMVEYHESFGDELPGSIARTNQRPDATGGKGDRLFTKYVLACGRGTVRPLDVKVVRKAYVNGVYSRIGEKFFIRPVGALDAGFCGEALGSATIARGDCSYCMSGFKNAWYEPKQSRSGCTQNAPDERLGASWD